MKGKSKEVFEEMLNWSGSSEIDFYPYIRDVFMSVFNYPRDHIRLAEKNTQYKIPDVSLVAADVSPRTKVYWTVAEVKKQPKAFRSSSYRQERWDKQLKNYVTADTVFALLIDPVTIAVLHPDGSEIKVIELEKHSLDTLLSSDDYSSLGFLYYNNSVSETSLNCFREGNSPSRFLDVNDKASREKFYDALRVSTRELIDFSQSRLRELEIQYGHYKTEIDELELTIGETNSPEIDVKKKAIQWKYKESIDIFEQVFKVFEGQIGRQMPKKEKEARQFLQGLYATEGSSLVLARILFVRFFEDHDLTIRKISNGGIKNFRQYHKYLKDDYQFLLTDAYKEAEHVYSRLFESSIFDRSHKGNGQLSRLLLRIFYRLNAFDFRKITGDILGNLYERFLDINKRKKLGEYYTPLYVAKYILDKIGFFEHPGPLLDPSCGSGTFLIAATTGLIEHLTQKGVKLGLAIKQAVELIHGLDINMFAAFIAQLQIIWHLLPFLLKAGETEMPELKIYGGVNSLEYVGQNTLLSTMLDLNTDKPIQVRDSKYKYVVGNPPYIRNERLKSSGPWRYNYDLVDFRNSDVSFYFVTRALEGKEGHMPSWLIPNGRMCFVLPFGIGDSYAATPVRQLIQFYKILEITDLEDIAIHIFPSPQASGRATVAPLLLFVEKEKLNNEHKTTIVQVDEKAAVNQQFAQQWMKISQVPQQFFCKGKINPFGQFLTKLEDKDLPVLEKIFENDRLKQYALQPTPCYGISVRGKKIEDRPNKGLLPMGKGQNIHTYYMNTYATKYVDVTTIPDNSIWDKPEIFASKKAFAVSTISHALQCAKFDPSLMCLSTSMIFVPKDLYANFPWDCLLNSSVIRFTHLLTMRAALVGVGTQIEGGRRVSWCTIYPRVIKNLPIPQILLQNYHELAEKGKELNTVADKIATRWSKIDVDIEKAEKQPLSFFKIDFNYWQQDIDFKLAKKDFQLTQEQKTWVLRLFLDKQSTLLYITGEYEVLNIVKYLIGLEESNTLTSIELQDLKIPKNYKKISKLIDEARDLNSDNIKKFKELYQTVDSIIAESFGLTKDEFTHIQKRLSEPPLDVLTPRWPWKLVALRIIQEYDFDRFE